MFSFGYCYAGDEGKSGYSPNGIAFSETAAKNELKAKLPGKKVTFVDSKNKTRAYADGERTGYIYYKLPIPKSGLWVLFNRDELGTVKEKVKLAVGTLEQCKNAARKYIDKDATEYRETPFVVKKVSFRRTVDNISVETEYTNTAYYHGPDLVLLKIA